jgi:hypothetical protein
MTIITYSSCSSSHMILLVYYLLHKSVEIKKKTELLRNCVWFLVERKLL